MSAPRRTYQLISWPRKHFIRFKLGDSIAQEYQMEGYWVTRWWTKLQRRDSVSYEPDDGPCLLLQKGDFVLVHMDEEWPQKPPCQLLHDCWVGRILEFAITRAGAVLCALQWYQRPEDTQPGRQSGQHEREILASNDLDIVPIETIGSKVEAFSIDDKDSAAPDVLLISHTRYHCEKCSFLGPEKTEPPQDGEELSKAADTGDRAAEGRSKRQREAESQSTATLAGEINQANFPLPERRSETPERDLPPHSPYPMRKDVLKYLESSAEDAVRRSILDDRRAPHVLNLGIMQGRALEKAITCLLQRIPLERLREPGYLGTYAGSVVETVIQHFETCLWNRSDALVSLDGRVHVSLEWNLMTSQVREQIEDLPPHARMQAFADLLALATDQEWDELEPELAKAAGPGGEWRGTDDRKRMLCGDKTVVHEPSQSPTLT
ncbi:Ebs-bah-phd domain-containing protein [Lasiodiplodia theobromae]|uniref:Ebs-bah-phd domain-containing protein n=1 Tax=Lasiodiplodia theobromae TaxID=45133 RepID=UPI0015C33DE0|nr:Ebs-bah-phd domain-containing protein [Lasiodiplodia theobromae]KAF4537819.1 Ebs-bah-phd domain-containing protein [Lasiodiplodia theobromae]